MIKRSEMMERLESQNTVIEALRAEVAELRNELERLNHWQENYACEMERKLQLQATIPDYRLRDAKGYCQLQIGPDGVWAHFKAPSSYYSVCLSNDPMSQKFALAYIKAIEAENAEENYDCPIHGKQDGPDCARC